MHLFQTFLERCGIFEKNPCEEKGRELVEEKDRETMGEIIGGVETEEQESKEIQTKREPRRPRMQCKNVLRIDIS
jgi:hypothetical protein